MCLKSTSRRFSPDGAWNQLPPEIFTFHHNIWWGVLSAQFLMEGPPCCLSVKSSRFLANFQHVGRLPPSSLGRIPILVDRSAFFDWSNPVIFSSSTLDCFLLLKPFPLHTSPFAKILGFSISTYLHHSSAHSPSPPSQSSVKGAVSRATRSTNPRTSCSSPEIWSSGTWGDGMLGDSGNLPCLAVEMWRWKPLKASLSNHVRGKSWQHTGDASWFHW